MKTFPDFFIIGAPKCGTTSLSVYLSEHPEIIMSKPKEPHYFSTDIDNGRITSLKNYLNCFSKKSHNELMGEASTLYLYSQVAVPKILINNDNAKFIVMLRNPLDLIFSYHQTSLNYFGETETDLKDAWGLIDIRKKGEKIPKGCPDPSLLFYGDIGKLGFQVNRLLYRIDRKMVLFILFDDFVNKTDKVYQSVLKFLSLDQNYTPNFQIHNVTNKIKYPQLTKAVNLMAGLKKSIGINKQFGIAKKIHSSNVKGKTDKKITKPFRTQLIKYFYDDILLLSKSIDKDLSDWIK